MRPPSLTSDEIGEEIDKLPKDEESLDEISQYTDVIEANDVDKVSDINQTCGDLESDCSGNGDCVDSYCQCYTGFVLPDCSMSLADFED